MEKLECSMSEKQDAEAQPGRWEEGVIRALLPLLTVSTHVFGQ